MQRGTPGYIAPELRGVDENDELSPSMGEYCYGFFGSATQDTLSLIAASLQALSLSITLNCLYEPQRCCTGNSHTHGGPRVLQDVICWMQEIQQLTSMDLDEYCSRRYRANFPVRWMRGLDLSGTATLLLQWFDSACHVGSVKSRFVTVMPERFL